MANLTAKVKAAIQANRDDIAGTYATQLEQTKALWPEIRASSATARAAFDKAMAVKQAFMREKGPQDAGSAGRHRRLPPLPVAEKGRRRDGAVRGGRASARRTTRWSARSKKRPPSTKLAWIWR